MFLQIMNKVIIKLLIIKLKKKIKYRLKKA